jgi:hypothetical protein
MPGGSFSVSIHAIFMKKDHNKKHLKQGAFIPT